MPSESTLTKLERATENLRPKRLPGTRKTRAARLLADWNETMRWAVKILGTAHTAATALPVYLEAEVDKPQVQGSAVSAWARHLIETADTPGPNPWRVHPERTAPQESVPASENPSAPLEPSEAPGAPPAYSEPVESTVQTLPTKPAYPPEVIGRTIARGLVPAAGSEEMDALGRHIFPMTTKSGIFIASRDTIFTGGTDTSPLDWRNLKASRPDVYHEVEALLKEKKLI